MSAPPKDAGPPGAPARPPAARRGRAFALALGAAGVAAAILLVTRSAAPPPAPSPAPSAPATAAAPRPQLRVLAVSGQVERAGADGRWLKAGTGDVLQPNEELRCGQGGRAELGASDRGRIVLADRSHVLVREVSADLHRFQLSRGLVTMDYQLDGARRVRIEAPSGGAIAESRAAHFHVSANGLAFAVATRSGSVDLSAEGKTVAVGAGEQSSVGRSGPPAAPRPIPTAVLLKVAAASTLAAPGRCLEATGRTDPTSRAFVNDEEVQVAEDGRFPIQVAARRPEGVTVRVVAPDGLEEVRTVPCGTDSAARIRELRMRWSRGDP